MAIANISDYLYRKYKVYRHIDEEVNHMITTLYNPAIEQEGIRKGKIEDILTLLEEYGQLKEM